MRRGNDRDEDDEHAPKRLKTFLPESSPRRTRSYCRDNNEELLALELPDRIRRPRTAASTSTSSRPSAPPPLVTSPRHRCFRRAIPVSMQYEIRRPRTAATTSTSSTSTAGTSGGSSAAGLLAIPSVVNWTSNRSSAAALPLITSPRHRCFRRAIPVSMQYETRRPRTAASTSTSSTSTAGTSVGAAGLLATPSVVNWTSSRSSAAPAPAPPLSLLERGRRISTEIPLFIMRTPGGTDFLSCYERLELEAECCVCFDLLLDKEKKVIAASCGHMMHDHCLRDWHATEREKYGATEFICPQCCQPITRIADLIQDAKTYEMRWYPFDPRLP